MALAKSHVTGDEKRMSKPASRGTMERYQKSDKVMLQVYLLLVNGKQRSEVMQALLEGEVEGQERPLKKSQAHYYIQAARERMKLDFEETLGCARQDLAAKYFAVYEEAFANGEYAAAKQCLDSLAKITGAFEPEKVNLSHEGNITVSFGFAKPEE